MKKRFIFVGGEKGGVGKSLMTMVLVSYLLEHGYRVYLIEGDESVPDTMTRYKGFVKGLLVPLARPDAAEEAVTDLFAALEAVVEDYDFVVINLPGGSAATLESLVQDLLGPTVEALNADLTTIHMIGPGMESVERLEQSCTEGLMSISPIRIAAPNAFFGDPRGFAWTRSAFREKHWNGELEFVFPRLLARTGEKVREIPGPYFRIANGEEGGFAVVERVGLRAWLRRCEPICAAACGLDEEDAGVPEPEAVTD